MQPLKVGLILDDLVQHYLVWDLINKSRLTSEYSIDLLVIQNTSHSTNKNTLRNLYDYMKRKGIRALAERITFGLLSKLELIVVARNPKYKDTVVQKSVDELGIPKHYVTPAISGSDFVYQYEDKDIAAIQNARVDVLIKFDTRILRGSILDVCEYGVLSFHHANNSVNKGMPAFWEVLSRKPSTGFVIQRLLNEPDGGDVVFKGQIATSWAYILNRARLYRKSNYFMDHVLKHLARNRRLPDRFAKNTSDHTLLAMPSLIKQLEYVIKILFHKSAEFYFIFVSKRPRWSVAYQYVDDWKTAVLSTSTIIKNPPNQYLADPFLHTKNGMDVIFVEEYSYKYCKGKISAYRVNKGNYESLGKIIEESFHLSYPFIFEADGRLFMCPETHQAEDIRIYECIGFPCNWKLHAILIDNVSAVDTGIFFYDGLWWMLTNVDTSDIGDFSSELHLFYADSFDSRKWTPHPLNPLIFDSECARNGGLLFDEGGSIYRVFQRHGFDRYGESMGVARIEVISTTDYKESLLFNITPKFFKNILGTHTYSSHNKIIAFDFIKRENISH